MSGVSRECGRNTQVENTGNQVARSFLGETARRPPAFLLQVNHYFFLSQLYSSYTVISCGHTTDNYRRCNPPATPSHLMRSMARWEKVSSMKWPRGRGWGPPNTCTPSLLGLPRKWVLCIFGRSAHQFQVSRAARHVCAVIPEQYRGEGGLTPHLGPATVSCDQVLGLVW